jgi:unsaturated chondroitin disaccharide hydrolase
MNNSQLHINELGKIIHKIDRNMNKLGTLFPSVSQNGDYVASAGRGGSWTGSFWTGMVLLAHKYTGDKK